VKRALTLVDMPFLSYQVSPEEALRNAGRLVKETGVQAVKIEGGEPVVPAVRKLTEAGIPVVGHLGLTPQSVNVLGGYRTQGKSDDAAERLLEDACALEAAGMVGIVLELIPAELAGRVSRALSVPTIGIGAGPECDGQVQVFHDLFGLYPDRSFKHNRRYAECGRLIREGAAQFVEEVRSGEFPPRQ
jgi:3-methyl-2-oxobutanoate hydroxymethyltransferase